MSDSRRAERDRAPVEVLSNDAYVDLGSGHYLLQGEVELRRADQSLSAANLFYRRDEGEVEVQDGIRYRDAEIELSASSGTLSLDEGSGSFEEARYQLRRSLSHGRAERIEELPGGITELTAADFTTCPQEDEGDGVAWRLRAKRIQLDRKRKQGSAQNGVLEVAELPILYLPYFRFPLGDERQSGLLAPSFGNSQRRGVEFSLPYYWNMAPNRDATLTPTLMSRRGLQLEGDLRYLYPRSEGSLIAATLPEDRLFDGPRSSLAWDHRWRSGGARLDIDAATVTDVDYLDDLGDGLDIAARTHLTREAELGYRSEQWQVRARVQSLQTVDRAIARDDRPYARLPELLFQSGHRVGQLRLDLSGEWSDFHHPSLDGGQRGHLALDLSHALERPGYFFRPRLGWRYTAYQLEEGENPDRDLPIVALDGGLIFERELAEGYQTLEPRLYYLYIPKRDQEELPLFDTSRYSFRLDQLFRENRFSGVDRIGDANQLSAALTTRWLDAGGRERLRAGIGQIHYFQEHEVLLPGESADQGDHSSLVAQAEALLPVGWSGGATVVWDDGEAESTLLEARYRGADRLTLNLGYRNQRGILEQSELAAFVPIDERWRGLGRWVYSLKEGQTLEAIAGFEYESCCWAMRMAYRSYIIEEGEESDDNLWIQFVFKGLGSVGSGIDQLYQQTILADPWLDP